LTVGKGNGAYATNTAFGTGCLAAVTANSNSTAIGSTSLQAVSSGVSNTAIGSRSLESCQIGDRNTAVGFLSSVANVANSDNVSVGYASIFQTVGNSNTAVGSNAGANHLIGSNNAFFGSNAQPSATTISDEYTYGGGAVQNHRFVNGNVVLGAGNVVVASARGIDFSATAGAGTSELFDDYEEGTWVPTDVSGAAIAITGSNCVYTKIGRIVTIEGLIIFPANASAATAAIGGLPFINANILGLNPQYGSEATLAFLYGGPTSTIALYTIAQTLITNATMSNDSFFLSGTYTAAT
jgi:hypothetical protein